MKHFLYQILLPLILITAASLPAYAQQQPSMEDLAQVAKLPPDVLSAAQLVVIFDQTCYRFTGAPRMLIDHMTNDRERRGYKVLPKSLSEPFVQGKGRVWSANTVLGRFVVALKTDMTCSVFAKIANADAVQAMFKKQFDKGQISNQLIEKFQVGDLQTHIYSIYLLGTGLDDERNVRVVVSTTNKQDSEFQAVMSMNLENPSLAQ